LIARCSSNGGVTKDDAHADEVCRTEEDYDDDDEYWEDDDIDEHFENEWWQE
jgi:hypothetical protein